MTTTVAEMIEWMKTMPQDAVVIIPEKFEHNDWHSTVDVRMVNFDMNNPNHFYVNEYAGKKTIEFGVNV